MTDTKMNDIKMTDTKMDEMNAPRQGAANNAASIEKVHFSYASIKKILETAESQDALKKYVFVPNGVVIKSMRKAYKNEETNVVTQKVEAVSGTSLTDMVIANFTLEGMELDPVSAINKPYRIVDYRLALDANMAGGKFNGYAAKGLRLIVTKIEEVKGEE